MIPYLVATVSRYSRNWSGESCLESRSSCSSICTTASLRKVAGPARKVDRFRRGDLGAGAGDRFDPFGHLAGEAALQPQQPQQVLGQQQLRQALLDQHDHRFFAELGPHPLRRFIGRVGTPTRVDTPASVSTWVAATAAAIATTPATTSTARAWRTDHAAIAPNGRRRGTAGQSIESGPLTSAWRNWLTNGLDESKTSSFGPDSTILPLHSTAMKSAIRRAVLRSWLITR